MPGMSWWNPTTWTSPVTPPPKPGEGPRLSTDTSIAARDAPGASRGLLSWLRQAVGGWPGAEVSRRPGSTPGRELSNEKVHSGPAGVVYPAFLPWVDDVTGESPQARLAYRKMVGDPNIKAALFGKVLGTGALELKIQPADRKSKADQDVAKFVRWNLTERVRGGWPAVSWSILSGGMIDGHSICEKVWGCEDRGTHAGRWPLVALKSKDVGNDVVLQLDSYRNVVGVLGLRYNAGIQYSPANFLIYRHMSLYETPTGMSDLRAAYRPYWILDTAWKLRAIATEKRAVPFVWASYADVAQKPSLDAMLAAIKSQNWASVPEGVLLQVLDIAGSADAVFKQITDDLREEIFLGIQGATLQALLGGQGEQRGNSKIHKSTSDLFKWALAQSVESLLNDRDSGLIRDIVDLNFVVQDYPRASLGAVDVGEMLEELQIDSGLHAMKVPLSRREIYEKYNRTPPDPDDPADALVDEPPPGGPGGPGAPPGAGGGGDGEPGAPPDESPFGQPEAFSDWDEGKHKRARDGKFGSGGSSGGSKPSSPPRAGSDREFDTRAHGLVSERPDEPRMNAPERVRQEEMARNALSVLGDVSLSFKPGKGLTWLHVGDGEKGQSIIYGGAGGLHIGDYVLSDPTPEQIQYAFTKQQTYAGDDPAFRKLLRSPAVREAGKQVEAEQKPHRAARLLNLLAVDGAADLDDETNDLDESHPLMALWGELNGMDADHESLPRSASRVRKLVAAAKETPEGQASAGVKKIERRLGKVEKIAGVSSGDSEAFSEEELAEWIEAFAEGKKRAEGEKWETGGRMYERVGGKTVRRGKEKDQPVAKDKGGKKPPPADKAKPKAEKPAKLSVDDAHALIKEHIGAGKIGAEHAGKIADALMSMTVAEMTELKKRLGLKASGPRAELAQKLAERALASAKGKGEAKPDAKEKKPKAEPKPKAEKKGKAEPKPEEKPAAKESAKQEQPKGNASPKPVEPMSGHPLEGKSDQQVMSDLASYWVGITKDKNPWKLKPDDRADIVPDVVEMVRQAQAKNSFLRPSIKDLFASVRQSHPDLTLLDFQQALFAGEQSGAIRLGAFTQTVGSASAEDRRYMIPLDLERKFYVDLGKNADLVKPAERKPEEAKGDTSTPQPPEPGFTGVDSLGRRWTNGKLDAAKDEQPKGRQGKAPEEPTAGRKPASPEEAHATLAKAFQSLERKHNGFVPIADLADATGWSKADLHQAINDLRRQGALSGSGFEGGRGSDKDRARLLDHAIQGPGGAIAYVSVRDQGALDKLSSKGGAQPAAPGSQAAPAAPESPPPEPNYSGTDTLGREWKAGKLTGQMTPAKSEMGKRIQAATEVHAVVAKLASLPSLEALQKEYVDLHEQQAKLSSLLINFGNKKGVAAAREKAQIEKDLFRKNQALQENASAQREHAETTRQAVKKHLMLDENRTAIRTARIAENVPEAQRQEWQSASQWLDGLLAKGAGGEDMPEYQVGMAEDNRAEYVQHLNRVNLDTVNGKGTGWVAVHEMSHGIEHKIPGIKEAVHEFWSHRFGDEEPQQLNKLFPDNGFTDSEMGRKDQFEKLYGQGSAKAYYAGKFYADSGSTELVSMGVEQLYRDGPGFARKDPEYCAFIVGILNGSMRNKPKPAYQDDDDGIDLGL